MFLYEELGITAVDQLSDAIEQGRLEGLRGFGTKTQENIVRGIQQLHASGGRVQIARGLQAGEVVIIEGGYGLPDGAKVQVAGEGK